MNIVVLFFSLNFNSLLFIPNFTNATGNGETTIEETAQTQDTTSSDISQDTSSVVDQPTTTPQDTSSTTNTTSEGNTDTTPNTQVPTDNGATVSDVLGNISSNIDDSTTTTPQIPNTTLPDIWVNTDVLTGIGTIPVTDNTPSDTTSHDSATSQTPQESTTTWTQTTEDQYIDDGYFTSSFTKGVYDAKILDLQNILKKLGLFSGQVNGTYDDVTIESVYQYQLSHNLIDPAKDDAALRGFFGPKTRVAFNKEYVTYKQDLLNGITQIYQSGNEIISSSKATYDRYIEKIKSYFLDNQYSLENIFGTWVFVGNSDIDFSLLSGKIDLPLIFQSANTLDGNTAEVTFEQGTILKTENGDVFTWNLASPEFLDISVADELTGQNIVSVLDVGGNDENKIFLEDGSGAEISSKIKMPVPGQSEWTIVSVNYSHDGDTWYAMDNQKVFLEDGQPYVEFETNHFTLFSVGLPIGSFFINNNDFSTSQTGVILNSNISGATQMRFANTGSSLSSASWTGYATWYTWFLWSWDGYKTVYAEFSGAYGSQTIQDTIFLDTSNTGSSLRLSLNGIMSGTIVKDATTNANNFTGMWGITNPVISWEQTLSFNWTSQYAERTGIALTAYPFTLSAWVNATSSGTANSIMMIGNSGSNAIYFGIQLSAGKPAIVAMNTTSYVGVSAATVATGQWYHIVGVFSSATDRKIYVNWDYQWWNATSVTFTNTNQQLRVGRNIWTGTNYFSGYIDDARVYNVALSTGQIQSMYQARAKTNQDIQYLNDGEFLINSGATNTYVTGVTLNSNVPGVTQMRFWNTTGALTSASWVAYATGYSWTLDSVTGNKIVYAQYSWASGVRDAQENIFLDTISDANLKVLLAWNMSGTIVKDTTTNANNFTWMWGITNPVISGEQVLSFNGTSQYAERTGIALTAYPFTLSAWVNVTTGAWTRSILMLWNSGTTTTYYGIQLINGLPSIVATNTAVTATNSTHIITTGQWYHIVGVFASATSRTLYVNGSQEATNATSVLYSGNTNAQLRVGRYVATATNYFSGYIDDARVYNKTLTQAEITTLYKARTSRVVAPTAIISYSTTSPTTGSVIATLTWFSENGTTILNNGGSNTYTFTWNGSFTFMYKDADGNIGSTIAYVNRITPPSWTLSISWPTSFAFGSTPVSATTNSLEKPYTWAGDYFQVADNVGADAWYYTTLAVSNLQYSSNTISNANIYVKTVWWVSLLAGTANANVISSIGTTYLNASSPLTFLMRSAWTNSGKTGTYWAQISIRVDIPAFQQAGSYTGTIIYTIY